jgi:hypothetical protein
MNIMDAVGPLTPHSDVHETPEYNIQAMPTPMCTQPEFDSQSTQPTPQWSDTQDIGYPYSGSMSFTKLLQSHWGPPANDAGHSQWQPQADEVSGSQCYPQSCVDQAPLQYILQTSEHASDNPTEWYAQHHHTGSDYTFTRRQEPSQATEQRARQPPDNFTQEDFMHRQRGRRGHKYDSLHT